MNAPWGIMVVIYLYLAGMAGGIYFTLAMYEFFNGPERATLKRGYLLAFCLIIIAVFFLILDLERPWRFIHMMLAYKFFSPMSMGSWALLFFGINTFVTLCMNSEGKLKAIGSFFRRLLPYKIIILIGSALSVFLTAYTGVLLGETTVTIWMATPFLGALFLSSGFSCGICILLILNGNNEIFVKKGKVFDNVCLVVELTVVLFFILSLTIGSATYPEAKKLLTGIYGLLFLGGGIMLGVILPMGINMLHSKEKLSPALVLVGGFLLRYAIVYAGQ